jgi:hypothetical protein
MIFMTGDALSPRIARKIYVLGGLSDGGEAYEIFTRLHQVYLARR